MTNIQLVTSYFHAAYSIAAVIYIGYIVSLSVRARRATRRATGSQET